MNQSKYLISTLSLAIALGLSGCDNQPSPVAENLKQPVQVIRLANSKSVQRHQFTGKLTSSKTAAIAFRVPGLIHELLVQPGDSVVQGQVVARLDPHDYIVSVRELEARLAEAKAAHKLAKIELKRTQQAQKEDAISSVSLDRAQSSYERSKAMVEVVTQNLQRAKDALRYTELKAPFDGVIAKNNFETFEQVAPGISVFTIHKTDQLNVEIDVPENMINQFRTGAIQAQVAWYQSDNLLTATLAEVESVPDLIKQTYTVTYQIDKAQTAALNVLPGKSVTVNIPYSNTAQLYCVPYSAVLGSNDEHHVLKVVQSDSKVDYGVEAIAVDIEAFKEQSICLKGDLTSKDIIVVAGGHYLNSGDVIGALKYRNDKGVLL